MKKILTISLVIALLCSFSAVGLAEADDALKVPYAGDTVKFTALAADVGVTDNPDSYCYQVYKKAVGNIDVDWELIPFSDFDTKAKIYFNSGEVPDIVWYRSPELIAGWGTAGLFLDLNKYKDYTPNWNKACDLLPELRKFEMPTGEQYMIHGVDNDYPEETFVANKTMLDKYGIALPTNLAELEAAMQTLREKDPSVTPFHTFWGLDYYESVFACSLGARGRIYFDLESKTWKHPLLNPEAKQKELITLLADYYAKGYFNLEFSTMSDEQTKTLISSSNWGFTFTYGGQTNEWYSLKPEQELPIEAVPLLPLAAEGVKPNVWSAYVSDAPYWGYSISANCANPELAAGWVDAMLSDPVADAFQWGEEGVSYIIDADGNKQWKEDFLAQGADAVKAVGIWATLGPRYITKRDDTSLLRKASKTERALVSLLVDNIKNGTIDSPYYRNAPKFSDEENERISEIMTPINTLWDEGKVLFVLGQKPMSEWDSFIEQCLNAGNVQEVVDMYNNAPQQPDRRQGIDRNYIHP